jgi:hypothetical protein
MIPWETCKNAFRRDGSLRDIYISPATIEDWRKVFQWLRDRPGAAYQADGDPAPMPEVVEEAFAAREAKSILLRYDIGSTVVNFHFFTDHEIECDFSPTDITCQQDMDSVLSFLRDLSTLTGRRTIMTPENCLEDPLISYCPVSGIFSYHPENELRTL